ncbi:MAG TPA: aldose epimerase family protein [Devosia sp.]|nr:aldose epimerase family protein [Devosiaceae bacterium]HVY51941.1 aldose epimerase family protein [Devosia sp.]
MVAVKTFGEFEGRRVDQFTLTSTSGVEVDIINWGVVVRDWRVPVKGGRRSVVLGLENFDHYPKHSPHFGAVTGRIANRVRGASFELGGKTYRLPANDGAQSLHGGPQGLGRLVWDAQPDDATNSVVFSLVSPDGAAGYPGTLEVQATYRLDGNRLRLELEASTDQPTPVSLVQHQYFNLGEADDVLDHRYWFRAHAYTENDAQLVPTGNILEIQPGSERDFSRPRTLREASGRPIAYDGNFVLDAGRDLADPVAIVTAPEGELTLKLWTDRPGLQFYNAVTTNVPVPGLGGRRYGRHSGFCLEDQLFPDALHHPHFPSIIITPEKPYSHWCEFEIA